ncbi:hypothetical protein ACFQXA_38805 [Nocardiopsis composta]
MREVALEVATRGEVCNRLGEAYDIGEVDELAEALTARLEALLASPPTALAAPRDSEDAMPPHRTRPAEPHEVIEELAAVFLAAATVPGGARPPRAGCCAASPPARPRR